MSANLTTKEIDASTSETVWEYPKLEL
jgi:hypothetical protein